MAVRRDVRGNLQLHPYFLFLGPAGDFHLAGSFVPFINGQRHILAHMDGGLLVVQADYPGIGDQFGVGAAF